MTDIVIDLPKIFRILAARLAKPRTGKNLRTGKTPRRWGKRRNERTLVADAAPEPSRALSRQDLIDALITMGTDPRTAERMSTDDLRSRYNRLLQRQKADA